MGGNSAGNGAKPVNGIGDFEGAFATAPVKLDATYTTPDESHAMMEPHASTAAWNGDKLTIWTSNQMITWGKGSIAKNFGIPAENVRLDSPYIGGGFGGKLFVRADAVLAALAAKPLRCRCGHRQCDLQRHRNPGARLSDHARQAPGAHARNSLTRSGNGGFRSSEGMERGSAARAFRSAVLLSRGPCWAGSPVQAPTRGDRP